MSWNILQVRPKSDAVSKVVSALKLRGVPVKRATRTIITNHRRFKGVKLTREIDSLLGYLFVAKESVSGLELSSLESVSGFLGRGGYRSEITSDDLTLFLEMISSQKSGKCFKLGQVVKITSGPFESVLGVVASVSANRYELELKGGNMRITAPANDLSIAS